MAEALARARAATAKYTVVDEDGASVYSASDVAREEFPDLDLTIRGAISIGRRLQDPAGGAGEDRPQEHRRGPVPARRQPEAPLGDASTRWSGRCVNRRGRQPQHRQPLAPQVRVGHQLVAGQEDRQVPRRQRHDRQPRPAQERPRHGRQDLRAVRRLPQDPREPRTPWTTPGSTPRTTPWPSEILAGVRAGRDPCARSSGLRLKEKYGVGDTTLDDILAELKQAQPRPPRGLPEAAPAAGRPQLRGPPRGHEGDRQGQERRGLRRLRRHRHQGERPDPRLRSWPTASSRTRWTRSRSAT
ncbi:MAG: hypothetical protein MZV63_13310 [Marinilabiliales bacterium]|nr:hypothetical protein [Marinilabiliales bacterium]